MARPFRPALLAVLLAGALAAVGCGAKAETGPCILMLVGEGPMTTTRYVPKDPSKAPEGQDFVPPPAQ